MKNLFHHFHEIFSSDFYHKISCGQDLTSIMRPLSLSSVHMVQNFLSVSIASSSQESSMDPVSREYSLGRDSLQFSKSPLDPVGIMFITRAGNHKSSTKSPDNFKIQMVKFLLPILGGLINTFQSFIYLGPSRKFRLFSTFYRFNKKKRHFSKVCMIPLLVITEKMLRIKCLELCDVINKPIL